MLTNAKHSAQLFSIGWTLARHDALFPLEMLDVSPLLLSICRLARRKSDLRPGVRLALALQELGPSFIKLGQALSTRADLLGEKVAEDLSVLQDRLPPFPIAIALATVEEQLGGKLGDFFAGFEATSIAAASIAQVHFAETTDGRSVAVKILRPGIEEAFARDVALLRWLAEVIEERRPHYRRLKPVEMVETFAATVRIELDLRLEAAAAEELRANSKDDPDFHVPAIDWPRTARRVLTLERLHGFPVSDTEGLKKAGVNLDAVMEKAARAFFNQVFRDGFFHADMHPGNLFVLPDGRLAPVDFGIMGRIDHQSQLVLAQILWSLFKGDYMAVARLHREAGYIPPHVSVEAFAQAVRAVGQPIAGKPLREISVGRVFGQLISIARNFEMEAQPHLLLLQKTMVTAEGVGRSLNPTVNMWKLAEPLIKDWADTHLSAPARIRAYAKEAIETLREAPRVLREMKTYLEQAREKGITISPESSAGQEARRTAEHKSHMRLLWTVALLLTAVLACDLWIFLR